MGINGPNPIEVQLVNKALKRYKPAPSSIGITLLTREWVYTLNKPSAFKKPYANRVKRFLLLFLDV